MLGVTTVRSGLALDAGISEQVDETVIITGSHELTVVGAGNRVDVSTISAAGVDSLGLPLELACLGSPDGVDSVGTAGGVLSESFNGEEEELVGTAVGADILGLSAPVEGHDVRVVCLEGTFAGEAVGGAVDIDFVVVGADSQPLAIWGEGHNLNPFLGVGELVAHGVGGGAGSDRDLTVVTGNSNPLVVDSDSTRALGVWELGESGSTSSDLLLTVGDLDGLAVLAALGIPHHDLVVIT